METLVLSVDDTRRVIESVGLAALMDRMIEELEKALSHFSPLRYESPPRAGFAYEAPELGLLEWMPALETGAGLATIKVVGYHPDNPRRRRLPTVLSTIVQCDTETGHLRALLDGTFLTALRTGAATGIASRLMASPESRVLGVIGCGAQGLAQVHGLSHCFPLEKIQVFDIDASTAASFPERIASLELGDLPCEVVTRAADAVRGADILCTSTSVEPGAGPVFEDVEVPPSLHINAVGSDFRGKIEVPRSVLERSFVCADFLEQCLLEGECQQLEPDQIDASLTEVLQNPAAARTARDAISVYDSTGWALQDHVAAQMLVSEARRLDLGTLVEIESSSPRDPKNPYAFLEESRDVEASDFADWSGRRERA